MSESGSDACLALELAGAWDEEASPNRALLLALPNETLLHILKWLSACDLASLACVSRELRIAAEEPSHWRRLFLHRWPAATDTAATSLRMTWKQLFFDRDEEACAQVAAAPLFLEMERARRSQPPSRAVVEAEEDVGAAAAAAAVIGSASAGAQVASLRRRRRLGSGCGHECDAQCDFEWCREVAVCLRSGRAHACDDACALERRGSGETVTICKVTGRVRSQHFEEAEEDAEDAEARDPADEPAGHMGKAYADGYGCHSARELREAQWGIRARGVD